MSLTAIWIDSWELLENDVCLRSVKHIEHDTDAKVVKGWLEQADHFVVRQKRRFRGFSGHTPETGDEKNSFSWYVGGGETYGFSRSGRTGSEKYVCTRDRVVIEDIITGTGYQLQVWELQSKMEPVPGSYFEEAVLDAPSE